MNLSTKFSWIYQKADSLDLRKQTGDRLTEDFQEFLKQTVIYILFEFSDINTLD